jgi:hypothetical protein
MINHATILSSHKSTAHVNLLLTCCNCAISTRFHSIYLILFVGWFSFNLNSHSCNTCKKSQKNTSCRSLNMYLSRYLHGIILGFLLSFCAKPRSFVFNQLSIFSFVGFHSQNIPFYTSIVCVILSRIPLTQSHSVPVDNIPICWLLISLFTPWLT